MADAPLIYLAGAGATEWQANSQVLYQPRAGAAVQWLGLDEALADCQGGNVSVVVSVSCARLTHVNLSRKQARHLQRVLPYLLEEQLLDNPDDLWFVSRKGAGDHYQVAACVAAQRAPAVHLRFKRQQRCPRRRRRNTRRNTRRHRRRAQALRRVEDV